MNTPVDNNTLRTAMASLPAKARRVAAIGWTPPGVDRRGREWLIWRAEDLAERGLAARTRSGGAIDGVVCNETPDTAITRSRLAGIRARLVEGGALVLRRPLAEHESTSHSADVSAASALARTLQNLVLMLSELGFVIRRERAVAQPGDRTFGVLVARRDPYRIRPFRRTDGPAINDLFTGSFHAVRSAEAWRWKFEHNPYGQNRMSVATDDREKVVGHYAGVPFQFIDACTSPPIAYDALQLCDIMTAASVRHTGLGPTAMISRLWRHFYAAFAEHRVAFVIGFNTASSRGMALRFHRATELEPIAAWRRGADAVPAQTGGYRVVPLSAFDASCDRLFKRAAPAYGALIARHRTYLTWRYIDRPDARYRIYGVYRWRRLVGWGVFRRQEDQLVWGDALFHPAHGAAAEALVSAAVAGEAKPPRELFAWFAHRPSWWRDVLMETGWQPVAEPNELSLIYGMHNAPRAEPALRTLYYTMGDSDLF